MYQNSSTFRILIEKSLATDIHLGFLENDAIRGNDTINTFEEILQIAKYEDILTSPTKRRRLLFKISLPKFNIKDPNLNISIPLFSIHGNHDDPIGMEGLCSLDIFSNAGLVNYFGKIQSSEKISIKPVMFRKGDSNLSIYGLGSLKDSRLQKMFKANLVQAEPPPISNTESFNIFVLHQNRYLINFSRIDISITKRAISLKIFFSNFLISFFGVTNMSV
ncbi:hypothetical protein HZS_7895 [Henneguya salminicola]|nr:hypothetical protein HZS_7895 [Henneguya salminicola]